MKRRSSAAPRLAAVAARGFTLIEVLVALVIVALGMSALLETLSASANNISALRVKTVAEWIAMNQIANTRLALTAPSIGITDGDVHNCGNADWHWQQRVAAIDAVPGLLSITVSVRRTGTAGTRDGSPGHSSSAGDSAGTASAAGGLGASSLGASAGLGANSALIGIGCTTTTGPGSALGDSGALGAGAATGLGAGSASGGNSADTGAFAGPSDSIGPSGGIGPGAASGTGTSIGNPAAPAAAGAGGTAAGSSGGGSLAALPSAAGKGQNWLITLTGFRGNSLGAAVGESPDWKGSAFAGQGGANGIPNGSGGVTTAPPQAGVLTP